MLTKWGNFDKANIRQKVQRWTILVFLRENETFMLFSNSVGVWKWLTLTINFPPHQIPFIYPTSSSCFRARKVSFSSTYPRKWVYPFPVRTCYWKIILVYFRRIGGSLFLLFLLQYRVGWAEFNVPTLRAKRRWPLLLKFSYWRGVFW